MEAQPPSDEFDAGARSADAQDDTRPEAAASPTSVLSEPDLRRVSSAIVAASEKGVVLDLQRDHIDAIGRMLEKDLAGLRSRAVLLREAVEEADPLAEDQFAALDDLIRGIDRLLALGSRPLP